MSLARPPPVPLLLMSAGFVPSGLMFLLGSTAASLSLHHRVRYRQGRVWVAEDQALEMASLLTSTVPHHGIMPSCACCWYRTGT